MRLWLLRPPLQRAKSGPATRLGGPGYAKVSTFLPSLLLSESIGALRSTRIRIKRSSFETKFRTLGFVIWLTI